MSDDKPSPMFRADEGLVFICPDEAETQRAYCEALLKGRKVKLDGKKLTIIQDSPTPPFISPVGGSTKAELPQIPSSLRKF